MSRLIPLGNHNLYVCGKIIPQPRCVIINYSNGSYIPSVRFGSVAHSFIHSVSHSLRPFNFLWFMRNLLSNRTCCPLKRETSTAISHSSLTKSRRKRRHVHLWAGHILCERRTANKWKEKLAEADQVIQIPERTREGWRTSRYLLVGVFIFLKLFR